VTDAGPVSTSAWQSDSGEMASRLTDWAREHYRRSDVVVTDVATPPSGAANVTRLFTVDGDELVIRFAPGPDDVFPTFRTCDLDFERRVMALVRTRTAVPVPDVLDVDTNRELFGVPFLVTRAVEGLVPSDNPPYLLDPNSWFRQGTGEEWARFERSTIHVLVQLHRITDHDADTEFLQLDAPGDTALQRQLNDLLAYYDWARGAHSVPVLERGLDIVATTLPASERSVFNWGDSRPGNILYRDFMPVAVLDWEMATVGPPEMDVAWTTFFQKFFADMASRFGLPPVPDMFSTASTAATYAQLGGEHLDDLHWYEAFAACRFAIILLRATQRAAASGVQPLPDDADDLIMFAPLLDRLLEDI
jgi:aminoglycoside phosphotransferase (APT) family kinase protein